MNPATEIQIKYLKHLGYDGQLPITEQEAAFLIDGCEGGKAVADLEKTMLAKRDKDTKAWFSQQRQFAAAEIRQACDPDGIVAGFRIRVGYECEGARRYDGAFLPAEVAAKWPQLLPPYECVCQFGRCQCEFEEIVDIEEDDLPPDMPVIVAPGKVTLARKRKGDIKIGHVLVVAVLIFALLAVYIFMLF